MGAYTVHIESRGPALRERENPEELEEFFHALFEVGGVEPAAAGWGIAVVGPDATLGVDARDQVSAARKAIDAFRKAILLANLGPVEIARIEVMDDDYLERSLELPLYPDVVGVAEVAKMLGVSKQRVSELARSKRFPAPLYELAAGPIWVKPTVEAFVEKWDRKPGRPRKAAAS